ncbi:hypothetical protein IMG5_055790 [Ichthyophthirius multifiliis]|uniref:Transmembrane protein n=1 Tax=Ichthyophthirius multifiliis TaxID=5932 RepID=G0QN62_ICHMU|nr:hypothetical protein IMG5_055790 [Ichthyophthirius multifiliis]EGR33334.1 hypothetical protein IMG5_055790 [Ichthyophthirius multifiliis]|eukprot:XP_004037320.1 hypothetical protein IMG5_055790 [Ichthyophthirius multifiliis]
MESQYYFLNMYLLGNFNRPFCNIFLGFIFLNLMEVNEDFLLSFKFDLLFFLILYQGQGYRNIQKQILEYYKKSLQNIYIQQVFFNNLFRILFGCLFFVFLQEKVYLDIYINLNCKANIMENMFVIFNLILIVYFYLQTFLKIYLLFAILRFLTEQGNQKYLLISLKEEFKKLVIDSRTFFILIYYFFIYFLFYFNKVFFQFSFFVLLNADQIQLEFFYFNFYFFIQEIIFLIFNFILIQKKKNIIIFVDLIYINKQYQFKKKIFIFIQKQIKLSYNININYLQKMIINNIVVYSIKKIYFKMIFCILIILMNLKFIYKFLSKIQQQKKKMYNTFFIINSLKNSKRQYIYIKNQYIIKQYKKINKVFEI